MSTSDETIFTFLSRFGVSFHGAVLGAALAYATLHTVTRHTFRFALNVLREAPCVSASGLRQILPDENSGPSYSGRKFVVVRGPVEARSTVEGKWYDLQPNVLIKISQESGDSAVFIQRTQSCIFNEWKGLFGWNSGLLATLGKSSSKQETTSLRSIPFVLAEDFSRISDYVAVKLDGSRHSLPLTTVYHQLQPVRAAPYSILKLVFGLEYPVGVLDEEKILQLGKAISAVGLCSFENGVPVIKPCNDFPQFLSEMTKDQMIANLVFETKFLFWCSVILGSLSVGFLGYSFMSNWYRWKRPTERPRFRNSVDDFTPPSNDFSIPCDVATASNNETPTELDDIPDEELCLICATKRRCSAFLPCGHLVCCESCSVFVKHNSSPPKCPVCREIIQSHTRIYTS